MVHARPDSSRLFQSVLFPDGPAPVFTGPPSPLFSDLNLDQVVAAVVGTRDDYELAGVFESPLRRRGDVEYRQAVFGDLQHDATRSAISVFSAAMRAVRAYLALNEKQSYVWEKRRWLLDAAASYCRAVGKLGEDLADVELRSRGLIEFRAHLNTYRGSQSFSTLEREANAVLEGLAGVSYCMRIKGGHVTVQRYAGEPDYSAEVAETFSRFHERDARGHEVSVPDPGSMDHVDAEIADLVSRLSPQEFLALESFCIEHGDFLDPLLARFDREIQFYLAYLRFAEPLQDRGHPFSLPAIVEDWSRTRVQGGFDLALAATGRDVVANDFTLEGAERILVVTGPNQGGKTTFARMVGQLHYLAALGVPVPARSASLVLPDRLCTVFAEREDIATLRGRLDEELLRLRGFLDKATGESLIVLNEVLASTTLGDAVRVGGDVLKRIVDRRCAAIWVTFVDELSDLGPATVSMVASVDPGDPSLRTFKVVRRPADGRAYAVAIARKHGLSYEQLRRRLER
jgi:DNA mismatch repair ATPase MutS